MAEHLADGPRTAAEIAEAEGADPQATARFLRACVSIGLVAYAEKGFTGTGARSAAATAVEPPYFVIEATVAA